MLLSCQAESTKVMEKLDSSGTENNYMGLSELISVIIIFMTFYLNVTIF